MAIQEITDDKILDEISGGALSGLGFTAAVLGIGAGAIAVITAPALGAVGGLLVIASIGVNALSSYSSGSSGGGGDGGSNRRSYGENQQQAAH